MKNIVIAVEGMDGVGKTIVSKYIEEKYGFINVEKPTKYLFEDIDGNIDFQRFYKELENIYKEDERFRSEFFGKGNLIAVKRFKDKNIVIDRHIVSNYYWNGNEKLKDFYKELINNCGKPDLTIYLHASSNVREERLKSRDINDIDLLDETVFLDGYDKCIKFMNEFKFNYKVINTDNLTKEDVFIEIDNIIKTYLKL